MRRAFGEATHWCPRCGMEKPLEEFSRDASKSSGYKSACRECDNARLREYYAAGLKPVVKRRDGKPRVCKFCSRPIDKPRARVCDACRPAYEARRRRQRGAHALSPAERGYDAAHQRARRALVPMMASTGAPCARCGRWIVPGEPWDLGHDDLDRSRYSGPEHRACNRATTTHRKQRARSASRVW